MKNKNITIKVLMETMRKLNQEGYADIGLAHRDPKTGKLKPPTKNISLEFPDPVSGQSSQKDLLKIQQTNAPTSGTADDQLDATAFHKGNKEKNKSKGEFAKDLPAHASSLISADEEDEDLSNAFPMPSSATLMRANETAVVLDDPDSNPFSTNEPTRTMAYDLEDTVPDAESETEELVDRLSDQVVTTLELNGPFDPSSEKARAAIEDAIMTVLKDMDRADPYDRS